MIRNQKQKKSNTNKGAAKQCPLLQGREENGPS